MVPVRTTTENLPIDQALIEFGVTPETLTAAQRDELDTRGYTIFQNMIDTAWLCELREVFDRIHDEEGDHAGIEVTQLPGVRRLSDLVNKSTAFDGVWQNPRILAAAHFMIGRPFKLHSLNGHDPLPGYGGQNLHTDTKEPRETTKQCHVVNSMWMLDDVTRQNGATRVVSGTHLISPTPDEVLDDPGAPHPEETYLTGKAGDVVVFNAHLWHGCTQNRTSRTRRLLHCAFIGREFAQQTDQRQYLRKQTAKRLSPEARLILDV